MGLAVAAGHAVWALHLAFVAFMMWAPFSRNRIALLTHLVVTPFLWVHWLLNADTCALTVLERYLRGVDASDSFFHALVGPVYKIPDAGVRALAWIGSVALWIRTARQVGWADLMDELTRCKTNEL